MTKPFIDRICDETRIEKLTLAHFKVAIARLFCVPSSRLTWTMFFLLYRTGRTFFVDPSFKDELGALLSKYWEDLYER